MVDRYFWGEIERISPEAPVPVVEVQDETYNLGGAANVVNNLFSLGAYPVPFGVVGMDSLGDTLKNILRGQAIDDSFVFSDPQRPTTVKTRVIARNQHIVRFDRESREDLSPEIENMLIERFQQNANSFNAVIFQDYNKGVITEKVISEVIRISQEAKLIIAVDPKFHNFFSYKKVTIFKPNIKETETALITKIRTDEDVIKSGRMIYERIEPKYLLITRGVKGMTLFLDRDHTINLPTHALKLRDVSGAGDTVIATLVTFLTTGADLTEAATIANYAAGAVCEEVGIVPVSREKLKHILCEYAVA
jgi:rfaE bifunctional protein kinase chain/domain